MKTSIAFVVLFVALFGLCQSALFSSSVRELLLNQVKENLKRRNCAGCKDAAGIYCTNFDCATKGVLCAKTCGLCNSCEHYGITTPPPTDTGAQDKKFGGRAGTVAPACDQTCEDVQPFYCPIYKQQGKCNIYQFRLCKKTCGVCNLCSDQQPPASDATPTGVPATAPPSGSATLPCSLSCQDSAQSCPAWGSLGYCDPQGKYPDTITACQYTCKACRKCALPPAAYRARISTSSMAPRK